VKYKVSLDVPEYTYASVNSSGTYPPGHKSGIRSRFETGDGAYDILLPPGGRAYAYPRDDPGGIWHPSLSGFVLARDTVEALVSDHLGNSEKWSQLELVRSLTRMCSRKRPHDETIESGRLQELLA